MYMYVCNYVYTGKISWNNLISSVPTEVKQLKNEVWVTVHFDQDEEIRRGNYQYGWNQCVYETLMCSLQCPVNKWMSVTTNIL